MRENLKLYRILFVFLFCFGLLSLASTNVKADDFTPNEGYENESFDDSYDDSYILNSLSSRLITSFLYKPELRL